MNILVLGGSYFVGKHFAYLACREGHTVTVFNRGRRPLMHSQIREIVGDRHDIEARRQLTGQHYDAVVDCCAYEKNDIASVFRQLQMDFDQYIFISTCDVYEHGRQESLKEETPLERNKLPGEAGQYIAGKVALEEELAQCTAHYGVPYTSIRPVFIYGPDNYAPRESLYFCWIEKAGQILHPMDATGEFQMVYVEDVARAILNAIGNKAAYCQAYNLAPLPMVTYESFSDALADSISLPFEKVPVTLQTIYERQIPLPFPLTKEESNWYDGNKGLQLINNYTPLAEGLRITAGFEMGEGGK